MQEKLCKLLYKVFHLAEDNLLLTLK